MMARIALAALAMALLAVPSAHAVTFYSKETKTSPIVGFTGPLTTVMNDVRSSSLTLTCARALSNDERPAVLVAF